MKKVFSVVFVGLIFFVLESSVSWAAVCEADIEQYCGDVQPGSGALGDCIHKNMDNFTFACRDHLKKVGDSIQKIGSACIDDARNFCRDVKPGYGRVKACILNNRDKVSQGCQDALKAHGL